MRGQEQLFSTGKDDWETPPRVFDYANQVFGPFTIDLAASPENALVNRFYTEQDNALLQDWRGENAWCNCPYSLADEFIEKAAEAISERVWKTKITLLIPARTSNKSWHKYIFTKASWIIFVDGRLKFGVNGDFNRPGAPFPSVFVNFNSKDSGPVIGTWSAREQNIIKEDGYSLRQEAIEDLQDLPDQRGDLATH